MGLFTFRFSGGRLITVFLGAVPSAASIGAADLAFVCAVIFAVAFFFCFYLFAFVACVNLVLLVFVPK